MKKSTLIPHIFVNNIADHETHKKVLLDYINKEKNKYMNISNCDWERNNDNNREWIHYFKDNILSQITQTFNDSMNSLDMLVHNLWYQQYNFNDNHDWHTHTNCQYTNVYFVELPDESMKTEILDVENIDVKEGDILTFPSFMFHRSKPNKSSKRKTVISFNTSFDRINIDKIKQT